MSKKILFLLIILTGLVNRVDGQNIPVTSTSKEPKQWFQKFSIRGYAQLRYNRLLETNPQLQCEQCDASWGEDGGFFLRRVRMVFSGQINDRVYFYIQPDFASSVDGTLNIGQLRDAYVDVGLDAKNEFRFRIGQSKIPFGFENMQSSSRRLPLDRNDGLNSALKNERDAGVMFYWAPREVRDLYRKIASERLKGSGDYGAFGVGVFNGQTANSPELNDNKHFVTRFSYPFYVGKQIIEPGIQAYTGKFEIPEGNISEGVGINDSHNYVDQRVAGTFILYPQPFGIQAEYNMGRGPEYNPATDSIEVQDLHGGYATFSYKTTLFEQVFFPFTRIQYYDGGKKHERDARSYTVKELELGLEWQPNKNFELVVMYTLSSRRFEDHLNPNNLQEGRLLRIQAQLNY